MDRLSRKHGLIKGRRKEILRGSQTIRQNSPLDMTAPEKQITPKESVDFVQK